jgi:mono/diheme cytochrome c family protein
MKKVLLYSALAVLMYACSGNQSNQPAADNNAAPAGNDLMKENPNDPNRGIGKFTHVDVSPTLDKTMAAAGKNVYDVKCMSCHKLSDEKLVGPGWKGVTTRRTPEWVMNFVTNPDEMLTKDPEAQALLEICLVRMPNQNLSDDEARNVYEYMRQNDGVQ